MLACATCAFGGPDDDHAGPRVVLLTMSLELFRFEHMLFLDSRRYVVGDLGLFH